MRVGRSGQSLSNPSTAAAQWTSESWRGICWEELQKGLVLRSVEGCDLVLALACEFAVTYLVVSCCWSAGWAERKKSWNRQKRVQNGEEPEQTGTCWHLRIYVSSPLITTAFRAYWLLLDVTFQFLSKFLFWLSLTQNWTRKVILKCSCHPGQCGSVGWSNISSPKGCRFDSQSGYIPRLWVPSPVRAHTGGNQLMLLSCISVSLSLFLSPFLSL